MADQLAPADPTVVLPPAVRRAAARSAELVAQHAAARDAELARAAPQNIKITASNPSPVVPPQPTPTPPSAGSLEASEPPPVVDRTPVVQPPVAAGEDDYKHRFESTNGRLLRVEAEKRQLIQQNQDMSRLLATMEAAPQQPPAPTTPQARLITPTEETEYGAEMLDLIGRRAREIVMSDVAPLQREIEHLKRQLGGVTNAVVQDGREKLFSDLDRDIPEWRVINEDPDFISWLSLPDIYSGLPRQNLLTQAFTSNQSVRVSKFFHGFLAEKAALSPVNPAVIPAGTPQPRANGAGNGRAPQVDLASLAAPGRARQTAGGTAPLPSEKPTFTRTQVTQFYRDSIAGAYDGRADIKAKMEQEIFDAAAEGRIH